MEGGGKKRRKKKRRRRVRRVRLESSLSAPSSEKRIRISIEIARTMRFYDCARLHEETPRVEILENIKNWRSSPRSFSKHSSFLYERNHASLYIYIYIYMLNELLYFDSEIREVMLAREGAWTATLIHLVSFRGCSINCDFLVHPMRRLSARANRHDDEKKNRRGSATERKC